MRQRACQWFERPFPCQRSDTQYQIDDLQDGDGFDGGVEVVRYKVPEDFGPEEAFY